MLDIIMQFNVSARLISQITTIICQHMKKILYKKNMRKLDHNSYVNKNDT